MAQCRSSFRLREMLRLARIEDAETIATVHVCAWRVAYEGIVPAQYLASLSVQERANLWRRVISEQHGTVLLAVTPHGEVGFISFGPSRDKDGKEKAEYTPSMFYRNSGNRASDENFWTKRSGKLKITTSSPLPFGSSRRTLWRGDSMKPGDFVSTEFEK